MEMALPVDSIVPGNPPVFVDRAVPVIHFNQPFGGYGGTGYCGHNA